jgi:orotidine-5'-phosphate decarboxylase
MACAGVEAMVAVQKMLPNTEVLAVTVPTNWNNGRCQRSFGRLISEAVRDFSLMAKEAGIGGVICSPEEIVEARPIIGDAMTINTPGLRPPWAKVTGDDQKRVMTIDEAFALGADRGVIGRPILRAKPNADHLPQNPREAVDWALRDIEQGLAARKK